MTHRQMTRQNRKQMGGKLLEKLCDGETQDLKPVVAFGGILLQYYLSYVH